ncbi:hypothetical protein Hanom_Chr04g00350681 [Helianthus anomalus]
MNFVIYKLHIRFTNHLFMNYNVKIITSIESLFFLRGFSVTTNDQIKSIRRHQQIIQIQFITIKPTSTLRRLHKIIYPKSSRHNSNGEIKLITMTTDLHDVQPHHQYFHIYALQILQPTFLNNPTNR